jgi:hypothetical protein
MSKLQFNEDLVYQILQDLKIYGGCKVCIHCDNHKYPLNYCELGGCCGGGSGKVKEDMWKYRDIINDN